MTTHTSTRAARHRTAAKSAFALAFAVATGAFGIIVAPSHVSAGVVKNVTTAVRTGAAADRQLQRERGAFVDDCGKDWASHLSPEQRRNIVEKQTRGEVMNAILAVVGRDRYHLSGGCIQEIRISSGPASAPDETVSSGLHRRQHGQRASDCRVLYPRLLRAAAAGRTKAIRSALDRGFDIDLVCDAKNRTLLMQAAAAGQAEVIKLLLNRGANHRLADSDGMTAADYAKAHKHTRVSIILLGVDAT